MTAKANTRETLLELAELIAERNRVEHQIAQVIGRPGERGHVREFIASHVFDIELHEKAATKASDGYFRSGPLVGKSVNIKWYRPQEEMLDLSSDVGLDFYLGLTGPRAPAASALPRASCSAGRLRE